jgi:hypothetical protein
VFPICSHHSPFATRYSLLAVGHSPGFFQPLLDHRVEGGLDEFRD